MFVIPCKYNQKFPFIIELVESIRKHHPVEKIVVVDSDSNDKTYFSSLSKYDVIVEDVKNQLWQAIKDGSARAAILSMSDDKPLVEELNRIRFDQRITKDGQYASQVQNFIDQLTK
jgi:glycosyltransferase involved in cell wall biosynthesis